MKALLKFELKNYFERIGFYGLMMLIMIIGIVIGSKFLLSIGPDIFKNSPYTVAYMTGFLSLFCILFSTLLATKILFKEKDSNFNLILYATPIRRSNYLLSRFSRHCAFKYYLLFLY
jgi:ABC-type transport system involved in multi-copper enzyme maturation permease subunit